MQWTPFAHPWRKNPTCSSSSVPASSRPLPSPELAKDLRVITVDHRGMGDSDKPGHGHRVCRLSADVRDLLVHLEGTAALSQKVVLCGCSLGFTIICLYLELFGDAKIAGVAFVDQSAAMYSRPGWITGAPELAAPAMVADLAASLNFDFDNLADGIISGGFGDVAPTEAERAFFKPQVLKCDPHFLGKLMEDHANLDVRDYLPAIELPALNFIGGATKCHHIAGIAHIGDSIPKGRNVRFDGAGHFLYFEQASRFNAELGAFVIECSAMRSAMQ